ncbi:MAG: ABC transporter permease [Gammaproteobacteria bacterium]|nr:ABC transporter permease [Gammaproteobacteria bacterium]
MRSSGPGDDRRQADAAAAEQAFAGGEALALELGARRSLHPAVAASIRVAKVPVAFVSLVVILGLIVIAVGAPWLAPYDQFETTRNTFQGPSLDHLAGTDEVGRDQLARLIYGARVSLYVGIIAVAVGVGAGSIVGLVSGFVGGVFDLVVQRVVDALLAFPGIVLAMALVSVFGTNTTNALLAIAIVIAPATSRVIRSSTLSEKERVYVEAAAAIGASPLRVMVRHVVPNIFAPVLILATTFLGAAILIEAGLSFLGLATQPPSPSWGLMLATSGRQYMEFAPWLAVVPGAAISVTVLCFNLLGDVVRDVLDPRLRSS